MNTQSTQCKNLINDLCHRFSHIFEQLKQVQEQNKTLQTENNELEKMINTEIQNHEESISKIQSEILFQQKQMRNELQSVILPNMPPRHHSSDNTLVSNVDLLIQQTDQLQSKQSEALVMQIREQKQLLAIFKQKLADVKKQREEEQTRTKALNSQLLSLSHSVKEAEASNDNNQKEYSRLADEIETNKKASQQMSQRIDALSEQLTEKDEFYKNCLEDKFRQSDHLQMTEAQYRQQLSKNANSSKQVRHMEKMVQKHTAELNSKMQRMQILMTRFQQSQTTLLNLQCNIDQLKDVETSNIQNKYDNDVLKVKLELLTGKKLDDDALKIQVQKILRNTASYNQAKSGQQQTANIQIQIQKEQMVAATCLEQFMTASTNKHKQFHHQSVLGESQIHNNNITINSDYKTDKENQQVDELLKENVQQQGMLGNLKQHQAQQDLEIIQYKQQMAAMREAIEGLRGDQVCKSSENTRMQDKYHLLQDRIAQINQKFTEIKPDNKQNVNLHNARSGIQLDQFSDYLP